MRAPFDQLPFREVPEHPRIPHGYFQSRAETVRVASRAFGQVETHVRFHGSGPPLLLLHGFMTTGYSWRYAMEPLGKHFRCIIPDLVGCGRTGAPEGSYGPDDVASFIGDLVTALGIQGTACIGNSLGGYLAMRLAMQEPGALGRLLNLHSPGIPTARNWALNAALRLLPGWRVVLRAMVARNPELWVHRNVHYFDETLKSREEHREYARPLMEDRGFHAFASMLDQTLDAREMVAFSSRLKTLKRFPVPLLLVYARKDPMVPPEVGEKLHQLIPGSRMAWLEQGSHFAHVDAVEDFVKTALPFLLQPVDESTMAFTRQKT